MTGKINILETHGTLEREISGFCVDSRVWQPGEMYIAQPGTHIDGHGYITELVDRGCPAVLHSKRLDTYDSGVTYLRVKDTRKALSPLADAYFGHPSGRLSVIGITGTDGKSSTVSFTHQLLEALGLASGFTSTVEYKTEDTIKKNPYRMSTPEAFEIHKLLAQMAENGKHYAVIESTSHGLSYRYSRLADVEYHTAVLTNITHEHLEFHGTIERYADDKANLFRQLKAKEGLPPAAIMRAEEPFADVFTSAYPGPWLTYSLTDPGADAFAYDIQETGSGLTFTLSHGGNEYKCGAPLAGSFNVANVLAAFLAVISSTGIPAARVTKAISSLKGVKGRMETIICGQKFKAIVDYAHSPGSFEKILPVIKSAANGRLIILFGSAGERDTAKRQLQGRVADAYADIIVLSDEDPRGEVPMDILNEIALGCTAKKAGSSLFLIPDREAGIRHALSLAKDTDTVLFLGKGHESTILYKDGPIPWDESAAVRKALRDMGYTGDTTR